jgi:hypothetical protein
VSLHRPFSRCPNGVIVARPLETSVD